jgi:hypothetical protein
MSVEFQCIDCEAWVFDASPYRADGDEPLCFLCAWIRQELPGAERVAERHRLRAELDRD